MGAAAGPDRRVNPPHRMNAHSNSPKTRAATEADRDRVGELLELRASRYAGPIDRAQRARHVPPIDTHGNPIHYIVATIDGRDAGVVGITPAGAIVDWSVAADCDEKAVGSALLDAAEAWARDRGALETHVLVAGNESSLTRLLAARGYRDPGPTYTVLRIESFSAFLNAVLGARAEELRSVGPLTAGIRLTPGRYPEIQEPVLSVSVTGDGASVTPEATACDVTIHATATDFTEYLFGQIGVWSFAIRRARIRPWTRLPKAIRVLRTLRPLAPWYFPAGERR